MKYLHLIAFLFLCFISYAQVSDDFSDGDFTANLTWSGVTTDFEVVGEELKLNAADAGESYLVTPSTAMHNATWEVWVNLGFSPSSANRTYVYLAADEANLEGDIEGYYVMIGNTADEVSLYRQDAQTSSTEIIDGMDATVSTASTVRIRVTRDALGNWELLRDLTGGTTFTSEGTAFDDTYTTSTYFGVLCYYSGGNVEGFLFDDISVTAAEAAFAANSIGVESANSLRVTFNQDVDVTPAETTANYIFSDGFGNPTSATVDASNADQVVLVFADDFADNTYTLNLDNLSNFDTDETIINTDLSVNVSIVTGFRDITINEIYPDFNPSLGLPDAEFIELFNNHSLAINIEDFKINGQTINAFTLEAGAYVILTDDSDVANFTSYGDVVAVPSFPNLTNSGLQLILTDNLGNTVDSLTYTTGWYQDTGKDGGGYTLEQVNPEISCNYSGNWIASSATDGGTPGTVNSVFDNSLDTSGPNLSALTIVDANTILVTFDEPMDETSLLSGTYETDPSITVSNVDASYQSVTLGLATGLISGTSYTLTASGLTDCAGNAIADNTLTVIYDTEPPTIESVSVLSELSVKVVFDEEIAENTAADESNYSIDNGIGAPESAVWDDENTSEVLLSFGNSFEEGNVYTLSIYATEDMLGNALNETLTTTFTYSVGIDSLYVVSSSHLQLLFLETVTAASATNTENYSVDREIGSPISVFVENSNELLVNLIFQQEFDDNRDLVLTIEGIKDADGNTLITPQQVFEYDTSSPKVDTVFAISDRELSVVFSEQVTKQSAERLIHYEYDDIYPIHALLDSDAQTVTLEFESVFEPEVVYELLIGEVADLYGNAISTRIREEFVYDILPPTLDSLWVKSPNEVVLLFNETLDSSTAQTVTNYSYTNTDINPLTASLDIEECKKVTLVFDEALETDDTQILVISNLEDQRGNALASDIEQTIDNFSFHISEIIPLDGKQIHLLFNQSPNNTSASLSTNYTIGGVSITAAKMDDRSVILTLDQVLDDKASYDLEVSGITNEGGSSLSETTYTFEFDTRLEGSQFINAKTITLDFEVAIDQTSANISDFSLNGETQPVAATITDNTPETIKLIFADDLAENQSHILVWDSLTNVYGNVLPGYYDTLTIDSDAPSVLAVTVTSSSSLSVQFSELINEADATFGSYYTVDQGIGAPVDLEYDETDNMVFLSFDNAFVNDQTYVLTVLGINDLSNNRIDTTSISFVYEASYQPAYGELIITEIMADPSDDGVEFFELYNRSTEMIDLAGLVFADGNDETTFNSGVIEPQSYLAVAVDNDFFEGITIGDTRRWLTLNNSGESLSIYADESLVFSTTYSDDWYETDDHSGYSLEMVDTENYCGEADNWTQSTTLDGSAGLANTVAASNPDYERPSIMASFAEGDDILQVSFSEKIIPVDGIVNQISFDPSLVIDYALLNSPENTSLEIGLFEVLSSNENYLLSIADIEDCAGNAIADGDNVSLVQLPVAGDSLDIIINEILFNPRSGGVDFVEVYNNSEKVIDLQNWQLNSVKTDGSEDVRNITDEHLVLQPQDYLVLTSDIEILTADYPLGAPENYFEMSSFPSYNDDEGIVQILNDSPQVTDSFSYDEDYHFSLIDDVEGVTLERVNFDAPSNDPNSWQSAASMVNYATPGLENSQFIAQGQTSSTFIINPKVFFPNSSGDADFTTINYELDNSGSFANITVYSTEGRVVKELAQNQLLSTTGFVTWDGTSQSGLLARVGYYIIAFEIFDASGNKRTFKDTVVLGARF